MATLVHHATIVTPRDGQVDVLHDHSFSYADGRITAVGPAAEFDPSRPAQPWDEVIAADRYVVIPGLINTHHHLYQSLTRCLPAVQNRQLFNWLLGLYEHWRYLDYEAAHLAAKVSIAELLLHGCTTTSDHFYMYPPASDVRAEAVLSAAEELGIRIHLGRGAMTMGQSSGGLPPDDCVETDAGALADCVRVLDAYHDPRPYSLRRIDLAPCSPFNVTRELMRDTAVLARERNVLLHTHLAETLDEDRFCEEKYGCRPTQYLADLDWLGPDVYLAHCVWLNDDEIAQFARTQTGVSHNPTSNMRLGSGIAPIEKLLAAGVRVGLGVDGSSSNDGGSMLTATREALLSARVRRVMTDPDAANDQLMPAATALSLATVGGAACLHREELGRLAPGSAADFALFRIDDIALAGAFAHDPLAALVLCDTPRPDRVYVAGREVVHAGRLTALDEYKLAEQFNALITKRFAAR